MSRYRKKNKGRGKPPAPYRSWFEYDFHRVNNQLQYEPYSIPYVSKHDYTPDFVSTCGKYMFETKGRFRTRAESKKYVDLRMCLDTDAPELIFIFMDPKTPMPGAKRRKNGTKQTVREWAEKNNFQWCTADTYKEKEWMR